MMVGGVSGTGMQMQGMGMPQADDPVTRNIQQKIENAQRQIQELASNKDISAEDKMKKRQELQQQINELNNQLRQHQIEQRKEKQEKKKSSDDNIFDPTGQSNKNNTKAKKQTQGLSQSGMEAMISADTSMKQAAVLGSTATKMEGRAGVLEMEIKLDSGRPGSEGVVSGKQAELAKTERKAQEAVESQLGVLAEAGKDMQEAGNTKQSSAETNKSGETDTDSQGSNTVNGKDDEKNSNSAENEEKSPQGAFYYKPVDVLI